ncbi:response regulator transcription factor [Spirosoma sp. BT702]|uniref:Response regulator transcription factor n=1 Tax=Spirosoma profusum TaxID=2771354 RepID=A0A926Y3J0_9BACT|nr:response regulator transcription factor [Spirosoma profusum]MBD2701871.1 response regulator transcription factor [Spirosoma profusum]
MQDNRILLIDDHRLFNDGLKSLLNEQTDLSVCGQVFQASDALPTIQSTSPQLVLLDINLQGTNGIELGKIILTNFPGTRVLMLTMYNQPKLVDEVRRAGLHGYLLKDATTFELLKVIRMVLSGHTYFEVSNSKTVDSAETFEDDFARRLNLTFREIEVISLIREGLNNEEIATRIHLSIQTVKTHRKNIHIKLGITKATDLVRFAVQNGI